MFFSLKEHSLLKFVYLNPAFIHAALNNSIENSIMLL